MNMWVIIYVQKNNVVFLKNEHEVWRERNDARRKKRGQENVRPGAPWEA